jgi:phenylpyruvate tautomerase PptA (4-oxalocrotonate tautomerase family)
MQYKLLNQGAFMPNILIKLPQGAFSTERRKALSKRVNEVAAIAEQIPLDAKKRFLCWISIDEVAQGMLTCGGIDMTSQVLPCIAMVYLPVGVLDAATRASYVAAVHSAFIELIPSEEKRQLATSVILHEIPDGQWGANGKLWRMPEFVQAAGYEHLQSLV